jgi:hypothetical protein
MKIITITKIGYNAPSGANWCYGIFKIDTIDTAQTYNMAYTVKETFGGDSRFRDVLEKQNIHVIETKGVSSLVDMENKEFIAEIIAWYNKK